MILGKSINSILTPAFSVLNYEKGARPDLLGSALFSVDDIFPRLQSFRHSLQQKGLEGRKLYFAKVDVQACFDTIPQKRLMHLVRRIVEKEEYQVARYSRAKLTGSITQNNNATPGFGSKPSWKFLTKAVPGSADQTFDFARETEDDTREGRTGTVFINGINQKSETRRAVIGLLEEHIERNLIKIGGKHYRQKEGIPQGSIVSSLLCSYFYAELEREVLGFVTGGKGEGESLLLRLIDDFLVITTEKDIAERFVRRMHAGIEEFGVRVKGEKSRVNFELEVEGKRVERIAGDVFGFCGNAIGMRGLDLRKDWERRRKLSKSCSLFFVKRWRNGVCANDECETDISDNITVECSKLPGQTFYRKTLK